jgi:hypothetical protein
MGSGRRRSRALWWLSEARELEACIVEIILAHFFYNCLTMRQVGSHIQAFVHHMSLVRVVDTDLHGIVHERAGSDAQHDLAVGDVIQQNHATCEDEWIVIGQGCNAGAEADVACARRLRR